MSKVRPEEAENYDPHCEREYLFRPGLGQLHDDQVQVVHENDGAKRMNEWPNEWRWGKRSQRESPTEPTTCE